MKGKCNAYVLWPLAKIFQNWIADRSTARNFRVWDSGQKYKPKWISVLVLDVNQNSEFGHTLETRFKQLLPQWAGVSVACTAFYLSCLPCLLPSFCLCVCSLFLFWSQWFYLNIRGCLKIIIGAINAFNMHFTFRTSNHIKLLWSGSNILYGHRHNLIQKCFWPAKSGFKHTNHGL